MSEPVGVAPRAVVDLTAILAELSDLEHAAARLRCKIEALVAAENLVAAPAIGFAEALAAEAETAEPVALVAADEAAELAIDAGAVTAAPVVEEMAEIICPAIVAETAAEAAPAEAVSQDQEGPMVAEAEPAALEMTGPLLDAGASNPVFEAVIEAGFVVPPLSADSIVVPSLAAPVEAAILVPPIAKAPRQAGKQFGAAFAGAACVLVTSAMVLASYMLGNAH